METSPLEITCANPGCDQPGTNRCSACKTTVYCCILCQTADWVHHKEECPGHLRKVGMANLEKAKGDPFPFTPFIQPHNLLPIPPPNPLPIPPLPSLLRCIGFERERNCLQILRFSILALTKLQQLKECPIEDLSDAMRLKFNALNFMGRHSEALECSKEWYCLWLMKHTHQGAIDASFCLIHSCINNNKFADAALYARTLWETINDKSSNNHIPENERQPYIANGAKCLAEATLALAESGTLSVREKQRAGIDAVWFARKALEVRTQLYGSESDDVAIDMGVLASVLDYFNDVDDDETVELYQKSTAITARVQGRMSPNTAAGELNLASTYQNRARRALNTDAHDREVTNLELALPHYREAARIYRNINRADKADKAVRAAINVEEWLQRAIVRRVAAAAAASTRG